MEIAAQVLIGLVVTYLLGLSVGCMVKSVERGLSASLQNEDVKDKWESLITDPSTDHSGELLGKLERLLFFIGFWFQAYEVVGGWLAFKVAAKWEAWSSVIAIPTEIDNVTNLDYAIARRRWGSQRLMSFLVGTLANVLVAFIGVIVGKYGYPLVKGLFCNL